MSCLRKKSSTASFTSISNISNSRECHKQVEQATNSLHLRNIVATIHCDFLAARPRIDFVTPHHVVMFYHGDAVVSKSSLYTKHISSTIITKMRRYITDRVSPITGSKCPNGPMMPIEAEPWYLTRLLASEQAWAPLKWESAAPNQRLLLTRNLERFVNHLEEYLTTADLLISRLEKCLPVLDQGAAVCKRLIAWRENAFKALFRPSSHWVRSPWHAKHNDAIKEVLDLYELTGRQLAKQRVPYTSHDEKSIYRLLSVRKP